MADEVRKIVNAPSSVSAPFNPAPKDADSASMTPVVAPVAEKIRATPTATTATHESVKDVRSSVPKKYGVSGGTGWKTSKPKAGGGYLDNINRIA